MRVYGPQHVKYNFSLVKIFTKPRKGGSHTGSLGSQSFNFDTLFIKLNRCTHYNFPPWSGILGFEIFCPVCQLSAVSHIIFWFPQIAHMLCPSQLLPPLPEAYNLQFRVTTPAAT